jgi:pimeloyl-ACP methyl ester carboxylesterase
MSASDRWAGFETVTVETSGGRMRLHDSGIGAPVLLLHGIPASAELWRPVAAIVRAHYRVLVPDLIGFGRSSRTPGAPTDVASQAGYISEALGELAGSDPVSVVGQDIGGAVAQILATGRRSPVASLMLMNSVAYDSWPIPQMRAAKAFSPVLRLLPPSVLLGVIGRGVRKELGGHQQASDLTEAFLEPFTTRRGYLDLIDHICALDSKYTASISAQLGQLGIPFDVAWGTHDRFQPPALAERLVVDAGLGSYRALAGGGHFSPADSPGAVSKAILQHLDRVQHPHDEP